MKWPTVDSRPGSLSRLCQDSDQPVSRQAQDQDEKASVSPTRHVLAWPVLGTGWIAANRCSARLSWPRMCALTSSVRGVSGRMMSSFRTGTSGAYLPASLPSLGPVVWIRPTPLSVKSEALITLAHGLASRLAATCSVLRVLVPPRLIVRVGDRSDQFGDPVAELVAAVTNPDYEPGRDKHAQYRARRGQPGGQSVGEGYQGLRLHG